MDFIVEIQSFRDAEKKFLPKEVAVVSLQERVVAHWIVKPPCSFSDLPDDVKRTNSYCAQDIHGVQWFEGSISLHQLIRELREFAKKAERVYTHGEEKKLFLENVIGHQVIDIAKYRAPHHMNLERRFPSSLTCLTHVQEKFSFRKNFCALRRAYQAKKWIHSLMPENWRQILVINSDLFFSALQDHVAKEKKRKIRYVEGYDTVDDEAGCGCTIIDDRELDEEAEDGSEIEFTEQKEEEDEHAGDSASTQGVEG